MTSHAGWPISMLVSLACSFGGALLFASLYGGIANLLSCDSDALASMLKNFCFIVVFLPVFASAFLLQQKAWSAGRLWSVGLYCFIAFVLVAYMVRLFPASPGSSVSSLLRTLLWCGSAVGVSLLFRRTLDSVCRQDSNGAAMRLLSKHCRWVWSASGLLVVWPVVAGMMLKSSQAALASLVGVPLFVLLASGAILAWSNRESSLRSSLKLVLITWYPFCFLMLYMAFMAGVESHLAQSPFMLDRNAYIVSFVGFAIFLVVPLIGATAVTLIRRDLLQ